MPAQFVKSAVSVQTAPGGIAHPNYQIDYTTTITIPEAGEIGAYGITAASDYALEGLVTFDAYSLDCSNSAGNNNLRGGFLNNVLLASRVAVTAGQVINVRVRIRERTGGTRATYDAAVVPFVILTDVGERPLVYHFAGNNRDGETRFAAFYGTAWLGGRGDRIGSTTWADPLPWTQAGPGPIATAPAGVTAIYRRDVHYYRGAMGSTGLQNSGASISVSGDTWVEPDSPPGADPAAANLISSDSATAGPFTPGGVQSVTLEAPAHTDSHVKQHIVVLYTSALPLGTGSATVAGSTSIGASGRKPAMGSSATVAGSTAVRGNGAVDAGGPSNVGGSIDDLVAKAIEVTLDRSDDPDRNLKSWSAGSKSATRDSFADLVDSMSGLLRAAKDAKDSGVGKKARGPSFRTVRLTRRKGR
jgi:hypothetical protein